MGALLLPSERSTRFGNPAWPEFKTANFAAFGSWSETLLKNAESLRDSDALMRVAVPRRRGPAGLRDLFRFCRNRDLYIRRSWFSACARQGWYHHPRCALCAVEIPDGRLSKRLICRFLVSPIYICERSRRALPICFGTADFLFAGRKFFLNFRIPFVSPDGQAVVPFPAVFLSGAFQRFSLRLQEQNKVSLVRSVYLFLGVIHG